MEKLAQAYNASYYAGYVDFVKSASVSKKIKEAMLNFGREKTSAIDPQLLAAALEGSPSSASGATRLGPASATIPNIPAQVPMDFNPATARDAVTPSISDRLRFLEGGEVGAARRAAAIEQAALSASPGVAGGGPLVPAGGGPLVPAGGGPLVPGGGGPGVSAGGPGVPAGGPGRSMSAAQEAEAASSRLGRFLPKTRLGKAGLGVAGLGALGLGANYLMGEDEPASFSDRLMAGDLTPEELAALGVGGSALGAGAYYAADQLL